MILNRLDHVRKMQSAKSRMYQNYVLNVTYKLLYKHFIHAHAHTSGLFRVAYQPNIFTLWEKTGVPRENPGRQRVNVQTPHRKRNAENLLALRRLTAAPLCLPKLCHLCVNLMHIRVCTVDGVKSLSLKTS